MITRLNPHEDEWLAPLGLGNLQHTLQVLVSLFSIALVDIRQESEHADDCTSILAFVIVYFLLKQLMNIWLDVSLVKEFICERSDSLSITSALVRLFLGVSLSLTVVPVQDGWVSLYLEAPGELLIFCRINLGNLDLALHFGGGFVPFGLEGLAMAAPWCVELNHPNIFRAHHGSIESRISQYDNITIASR